MNLVFLHYVVPVIAGVVVAFANGFFKEPSIKRGLVALSAVLAGFIICWSVLSGIDPSPTSTPTPTLTTTPTLTPTPTLSLSEFHGKLSGYSNVAFSDAEASSVFLEESGHLYKAIYATRDDREPWIEGEKGDGCGEFLTLSFSKPETIDLLGFRLGFKDYYTDNNRPRSLQFDFSDGSTVEYEFEDCNQMQYVKLNRSVTTESIKITILSVYPGSKFADTCITLVQAFKAR